MKIRVLGILAAMTIALVAACSSDGEGSDRPLPNRSPSTIGTELPSGPSESAAPDTPVVVDPSALPMGATPAVPILDTRSGVLRLPDGSHRRLPIPSELFDYGQAAGRVFVLLGRELGPSRVTAYWFATGQRRSLGTRIDQIVVSDDGKFVAVAGSTDLYNENPSDMLVKDISTGAVLHRTFNNAGIAAFGRGHVLITSYMFSASFLGQGTFDWDLRTGSITKLTRHLLEDGAADWRHNRGIFVGPSGRGRDCPRLARLFDPGKTIWKAPDCRLGGFKFSPDGRYVLASRSRKPYIVTEATVLSARSGRILETIPMTGVVIGWESRSAYLVGAVDAAKSTATLRCRVGGACERVSRFFPAETDKQGRQQPVYPFPLIYFTK